MLSEQLRLQIREALRSDRYRRVPAWRLAKSIRVSEAMLKSELAADPTFEIYTQAKKDGGTYECVRFRLLQVIHALPMSRRDLGYTYGQDAVTEAVLALHAQNALHEVDGELRAGPGTAPGAAPAGGAGAAPWDEIPPPDEGPAGTAAVTPEMLQVLNALENIEQRRINFGLYETFTTTEEIAAELKGVRGDALVKQDLKRLMAARLVMEPRPNLYRSRISEIVRLLKNVKRRFKADDATTAPHLVQSVRVHFQDRRRLRREHDLRETFESLLTEHQERETRRAVRFMQSTFADTLNFKDVTRVQASAVREVGQAYLRREGGAFVITGNTGSGKTEAALLPLLLGLLKERQVDETPGVKVILVYPRQNLAKNQLERVCRYVAALNQTLEDSGRAIEPLSVGMVFGDTPRNDGTLTGTQKDDNRRPWERLNDGYKVPYFTAPDGAPVLASAPVSGTCTLTSSGGPAEGHWRLTTFRATREAIQRTPPDILIITTEMLNRWLQDPQANGVFGLAPKSAPTAKRTAPRAIVLDEIHLYNGIHGSQIASLLRRYQHRLDQAMFAARRDLPVSQQWTKPLILGMSATIGQPAQFLADLTGLYPNRVRALVPTEEDLDPAQGREYFLFIRPESYSRGYRVGDASAAIQTIMTIAHNMPRRAETGRDPAKHRSLVFQDSISKLKKLTVEFKDAETRQGLARFRLTRPTGNIFDSAAFQDGEYWYFEGQDALQYGQNRPQPGAPPRALTSDARPVYSGLTNSQALDQDIVFATTSLEVGYDDPSIQFVLQHHAPTNTASFVQKKGRAGRALQDRPITALTLSKSSFRDAFYYQNPELLTEPDDYQPALNPDNDFVQRYHAVALFFDELTRTTRKDRRRGQAGQSLDEHLAAVRSQLTEMDAKGALTRAYKRITSESLRRQPQHATWQATWEWFEQQLREPEVASRYKSDDASDLMRLCPVFPDNLFSSVNLPIVQVTAPKQSGSDDMDFTSEDVALTFTEFAVGRVSRRYGRQHQLHWRNFMKVEPRGASKHAVAMERYLTKRPGKPAGPFNTNLIRDLSDPALLGPTYDLQFPMNVMRVHGEQPKAFYRLRYLQLYSFGTLNSRDPRSVGADWCWLGRKNPDGTVNVTYVPSAEDRKTKFGEGWRHVSPDSNSVPLSFSVVRPLTGTGGQALPPRATAVLPPLFGRLLRPLEYYYGDLNGERSRLCAWEIHYGAETTTVLVARGQQDEHAGRGHNVVRYINDKDRTSLLYGYDLTTEGMRLPYDQEVLTGLVETLVQEMQEHEERRRHLQDQFLRYLLKSVPWGGGEEGLNVFEQRQMADILCTMRAAGRAAYPDRESFLGALQSDAEFDSLIGAARSYWRDHRTLNEEFVARARQTFKDPVTIDAVNEALYKVGVSAHIKRFLQDTVRHSLKHAARNMFSLQGSTDPNQVGSSTKLHLTHGRDPDDTALYVYERNQDGAGGTRAAARTLAPEVDATGPDALIGLRIKEWWRFTLECPIHQEEALIKAVLDAEGTHPHRRANVVDAVHATLARPIHDRDDAALRAALIHATDHTLDEQSPDLSSLATHLLTDVRVMGQDFRRVDLLCELLDLERALSVAFGRTPLPAELAGHALSELDAGADLPTLRGLLQVYRDHFAALQLPTAAEGEDAAVSDDADGGGEDGAANPDDRFLAQVESLSVSTCVDACPACLASGCDLGPIDVMRHNVSRAWLKRAHQVLTRAFTLAPHEQTIQRVLDVAAASGGFVMFEHHGQVPAAFQRELRQHGFQQYGRLYDPQHLLYRSMIYRAGGA